jgi:hypothetical protein
MAVAGLNAYQLEARAEAACDLANKSASPEAATAAAMLAQAHAMLAISRRLDMFTEALVDAGLGF